MRSIRTGAPIFAPLLAWLVATCGSLLFFGVTTEAVDEELTIRHFLWSTVALSPILACVCVAIAAVYGNRRDVSVIFVSAVSAVASLCITAALGYVSSGTVGMLFQLYWSLLSGYVLLVFVLSALLMGRGALARPSVVDGRARR